jgi:hypothetical protein
MKYVKKPIVIEAIRWTGNNLKEIIDSIGLHKSALKWTWEEYEDVVKKEGLKIFTPEGTMMANIGDYIIKGVNSEFYPCKPDIFEKTYSEYQPKRKPLPDEENPCNWEVDSDGLYHTDCGNIFYFQNGTLEENKQKFCGYCGKKIQPVEA